MMARKWASRPFVWHAFAPCSGPLRVASSRRWQCWRWELSCDGKKPEEQPAPAVSVAPTPKPPPAASAPRKEPKPEARAEKLTVLFGGDVNLGRGAGQKILKDPKYDPFAEIAPLLSTADFRAVNLESQLSDQNGETQSPNHHLIFTGPPGGADVLAAAHIDLVSLANNHAWDYGKKALFETFTNLERAGVASPARGARLTPPTSRRCSPSRAGAWPSSV